ncbi:anaphase promoting complex subunit 8, partial [Parasitella parasitica]
MIIDDKAIKESKLQLQQSIVVCSERCLFYSSKWAAEVLDGIKKDVIEDKEAFTNAETNWKSVSTYQIPYEASLPPLSEYEYNKYQYAKSLFHIRQFDSVKDVLGNSKSPKLYFLRLYAKYLAGEKRREELSQEIFGVTEDTKADNLELNSIYEELTEDHNKGNLDAFGLYLYGIVLRKRNAGFKAAAVLLESIRKYQHNWSAWMELGLLVQNSKMFMDLQVLVNKEFEGSVFKDFFLAKLCIDLHQPSSIFATIMEPLTTCFPHSAYVKSQWAILYYDTMDYNESLLMFEELRRAFPSRLEDMDVFSNLLYLQDSKDKLCVLALECDKIDKYRPETCCVRANYFSVKREVPESIEYFKRALKLNRSYHLAWTLLGHDYIELKNTNAAIECYRRAVGVNSRDYRAWYGLGQAYEVRKLPYDAIYYYQKATDLRPYDSRMWRALANCYQTLQQDDEARDCYKRAAACDKTGKNLAMIQLGRIFEKMGRMSVAIDYYHTVWDQARFNKISDELAEICLVLARHAKSKERYKDAVAYAATALNTNHPYHEQARVMLDEIKIFKEMSREKRKKVVSTG